MGLFKRILGICETRQPADSGCWNYSEGKLEIDLKKAPELSTPGGALRFEGNKLSERVLVFQGNNGQYHALRNKCAHMGRRLDMLNGTEHVQCCSVSKSTYDYNGQIISGPVKDGVKAFQVSVENDKLVVLLN
ncbi:MAG: Rieske 2Fe-2S domain-containing protein [Desulfobacteraceae bacterium]|nr:Rieske 2Fe-2S domain-containing protein [Desulfobacteraceae bacterium]